MSTNGMQMTQETQEQPIQAQYPSIKPRVDIFEGEDGLLLVAELPGVAKDDLKVHLHGDELTIEGFRGAKDEEDSVITEFRPTSFKRTFTLREKIDADHVTAQLKDGVLQLMLPKAPELKPRQIAITTQ